MEKEVLKNSFREMADNLAEELIKNDKKSENVREVFDISEELNVDPIIRPAIETESYTKGISKLLKNSKDLKEFTWCLFVFMKNIEEQDPMARLLKRLSL